MYAFQLHKPASVADAARLLSDNDEASLLAGGQTLIPTLKQRLASPSDLVDLGAIAELAGITVNAGAVSIGAMTRHATVAESADVRKAISALSNLAGGIGDPQVRNRGTMGGSVANSDPSADYPAAVLALDATLHTNRRTIAAEGSKLSHTLSSHWATRSCSPARRLFTLLTETSAPEASVTR